MLFNPLRLIKPGDIEKKVHMIRRENPQLTDEQLSEMIIKERSLLCAASGIITTLPAIFPVVGTLLTLLGGVALDISLIAYFMMRMIMEVAVINGRDIFQKGMNKEIILVFASAVGATTVSKTVSSISVSQMGNQALVKLVQQILFSLGIRSTSRVAVRIIPLIGAVIAGSINYMLCKKIGSKAKEYYKINSGERVKETINVEADVID